MDEPIFDPVTYALLKSQVNDEIDELNTVETITGAVKTEYLDGIQYLQALKCGKIVLVSCRMLVGDTALSGQEPLITGLPKPMANMNFFAMVTSDAKNARLEVFSGTDDGQIRNAWTSIAASEAIIVYLIYLTQE